MFLKEPICQLLRKEICQFNNAFPILHGRVSDEVVIALVSHDESRWFESHQRSSSHPRYLALSGVEKERKTPSGDADHVTM